MREWFAMLMAAVVSFSAAGTVCAGQTQTPETGRDTRMQEENETEAQTEAEEKGEGVMTYQEFLNAGVDDEVTIEAYVQGIQAWYEKNEDAGIPTCTAYLQDNDGGYFCYDMQCPEADYKKLTVGTKIRVTGYKAEVAGETEIVDANFEILEAEAYIAVPVDVTNYLSDETVLKQYQNQKAAFRGMKVEKTQDYPQDQTESETQEDPAAAELYSPNQENGRGSVLYFTASKGSEECTFAVLSWLVGEYSPVYQTARKLKSGSTVDLEGFLCWDETAMPHLTSVTVR